MLRVYIDDSGKKDHSSVLVLAGYLSTENKWKAFSKEWTEILDEHDLDSFRMAQAWRLHRKYHEAGPIQRNWLIVKLLECIKKYTEKAFVVSLDINAHSQMYEGWDELGENFKHSGRYYFTAFCAILALVYKYNYTHRFDQKLEVVFDEQGGESLDFLLSSVDEFKTIAKQHFPGIQVDTPTFVEDHNCPPIQAADLLAWLVRREKFKLDKDDYSELESLLLGEALSMGFKQNILTSNKMAEISEVAPKILAEQLGVELSDLTGQL